MLIQTITVNENAPQILIGRRGEYNAEQVVFDMSWLAETYGSGTATLMVKRPGDTAAYPAVTEQVDNLLTWTISAVDTSYKGAAECELFWTVGEALAKSVVYPVLVMRDIGDAGATPPDPYEPWVDQMVELGTEVQEDAEAAAASAAAAQAVLDSIPADYSELSETVDTLDADVGTLKAQTVVDNSYRNVLAGATSFQDNRFINDAGNVVYNPNFCLIDGYYEIKPETTYKLYREEPPLYANAGHNWTWWDKDKHFVGYKLSGSAVTSPATAKYLRFAVYFNNTGSATHETFDPQNVIVTEDAKPEFDDNFTSSFVARPSCAGLKWIGIGDSITEDNFRATYHYWSYIMAETGLSFVNMGVSGTGYKAEGSGNKAFYKRVPSMAADADIITIFGGVNDIVLSNADIGTATDTGTATICGCVNETIDAIEQIYPAHMPLGIISPLPCACVDTVVNIHPIQNPSDESCRMTLFVEQLALICRHRGIPFLDLFHRSNLRPWHQECNEKYFSCESIRTGDGLHPNGYGHRLIYRQIMEFVKQLAMQ